MTLKNVSMIRMGIIRKELETEFPGHRVDFVDPLSLSVSCHIGPGALAVAISKKVPELG